MEVIKCICLNETTDKNRSTLSCGHTFCINCIILWAKKGNDNQFTCPMCRKIILVYNEDAFNDESIDSPYNNYINSQDLSYSDLQSYRNLLQYYNLSDILKKMD